MTEQFDLFSEIDAQQERKAIILENRLRERYRLVQSDELYGFRVPLGTEVIVKRTFNNPKTFRPQPEKTIYYRTILGKHSTVSGDMPHLVWERNDEFPAEPPWQSYKYGKWIYPDSCCGFTFWIKIADENGL